MEKIFIYVEACESRSLDAKKVYTYFIKNKYQIVQKPKNADIIIFFTCAFINKASEVALNKVKEFQNKYDAELIVVGCLPGIEKEKLSNIFDGKTISTKDLHKIDCLFPNNKVKFSSINDADILFDNFDLDKSVVLIKKIFKKIPPFNKFYNKIKPELTCSLYEYMLLNPYIIRVSWGCKGNCSYCAIKKAIGTFCSKPIEQCIREFKKGLKSGYKEFVIVADAMGEYGIDIGKTFPELIERLTMIKGNYKIEIQSLDPRWLVKYIDEIELIPNKEKIKSIQICLQSGSNRILKLMNRYSNIEKIKDALLRLKKKTYPGTSLFIEFIIGFPTETIDGLNQTLSIIKDVGFDSGQFFPYSKRTGTDASKIRPQISQKEILRRLRYTKRVLKKQGYKFYYSSNLFDRVKN